MRFPKRNQYRTGLYRIRSANKFDSETKPERSFGAKHAHAEFMNRARVCYAMRLCVMLCNASGLFEIRLSLLLFAGKTAFDYATRRFLIHFLIRLFSMPNLRKCAT